MECTAEVWKTLRDKHVIPELKQRIVRKIQLLASGEWQPHLCKKLKNVPPTLNLFEAKFSKGKLCFLLFWLSSRAVNDTINTAARQK